MGQDFSNTNTVVRNFNSILNEKKFKVITEALNMIKHKIQVDILIRVLDSDFF